MFIRVWHKFENVGKNDCSIPEAYISISSIERFYSRKHDGENAIRHIAKTGTNTCYMTEETFEYLKSLKLEGQPYIAEKKPKKRKVSILGIDVGEVG